MGTNYYAHDRLRFFEPVHIGKSSGGWCFSLHIMPEKDINCLEDWKVILSKPEIDIIDEYGTVIPYEEMLSIITERWWNRKPFIPSGWYKSEEELLARNHAEYGPSGLLRHKIGYHCVGHGEGTWDYIIGDFS